VKALDWAKSGREKSFLLFGTELEDAEHQLATNPSKEPHPTDLQSEDVHVSRKAIARRWVRNASIATVAAIALPVLGVGDLIASIEEATRMVMDRGGHFTVVASICGTDADAQIKKMQIELLKNAGVLVFQSNARGAVFCFSFSCRQTNL
jgi:hypothetical protein